MRRRTLRALAGDGGVGGAIALLFLRPRPPSQINIRVWACVRRTCQLTLYVQGAVGYVHLDALRVDEVESWLAARRIVVQVVSERGSATLN